LEVAWRKGCETAVGKKKKDGKIERDEKIRRKKRRKARLKTTETCGPNRKIRTNLPFDGEHLMKG